MNMHIVPVQIPSEIHDRLRKQADRETDTAVGPAPS